MFYYLLHIPLLHPLAVIVCYARYGQVHWMFASPTVGQFPITPPPGWGFSLPIVCLVWNFRCGRALSALPLVCILEAAPQRCLAQLFLNSDDRLRDSPLKRVGADALVHPAARSAAVLRRSVATFALTPDEGVRGCVILAVTSLPSDLCSARRAIFAVGRSSPVAQLRPSGAVRSALPMRRAMACSGPSPASC